MLVPLLEIRDLCEVCLSAVLPRHCNPSAPHPFREPGLPYAGTDGEGGCALRISRVRFPPGTARVASTEYASAHRRNRTVTSVNPTDSLQPGVLHCIEL